MYNIMYQLRNNGLKSFAIMEVELYEGIAIEITLFWENVGI